MEDDENERDIQFSSCVATKPFLNGQSNNNCTLKIVHDLEPYYRSRYKTDYFGSNGKIRRPRYVGDCLGNHYVTLKVLKIYVFSLGIVCFIRQFQISNTYYTHIRVDWVTVPDAIGDRYWMPYEFQLNHNSVNVKYENPIEIEIDTNDSGIMKYDKLRQNLSASLLFQTVSCFDQIEAGNLEELSTFKKVLSTRNFSSNKSDK